MHLIPSNIDFHYSAHSNEPVSPESSKRGPRKLPGSCIDSMEQGHFVSAGSFEQTACIICRWVLSALKAHIEVICQSAAGVKAITPEHSGSQECICSEQMKETIVCKKHLRKANAWHRLHQCSAWSTPDHCCVIGVGGLQGCPDSSCQWENKEHVSCISSGS